MPQAFSGGFDEKSNPLPRIFPHVNNDSPQYERDNKYRDAVYMLDQLRTTGCKTKVHYQPLIQPTSGNPFEAPVPRNPFDVPMAVELCKKKISLRADFGSAIESAIEDVVEACYKAGYAIHAPEVVSAMYAAAVQLASVSYQTQLGQHQANYGTWDSSKSTIHKH